MHVIAIIPARFAATRFPGKPLFDLAGKSMIIRVVEQALQVPEIAKVVVATDDERILNHVHAHGYQAVMTDSDHPNGTSRIWEAYIDIDEPTDVILNIQGDEPFIQPKQIQELLNLMKDYKTQIGTLMKRIETQEELFNPNVVKVVTDTSGKAMYFSRQCIPFLRDEISENWLAQQVHFKHIGLYAYKPRFLRKAVRLKPSTLEELEKLEQLRWLENQIDVYVCETQFNSIGIDTPEDAAKAIAFLNS